MLITIEDQKWDINIESGILKDMQDDGYDEVTLKDINPSDFQLFYETEDASLLSIEDNIRGFKIAHYLNVEDKMVIFGREVAKHIKKSGNDYQRIRYILDLF